MNLLIIRVINYKNKNKNKKFNSALKTETSENKNKFKSHNKNKNKNKSETKFKKSNEILMSDNVEKKNSHTLIVIIVKNSIHNHAFISILSLQKKNNRKATRLK